MASWPSQLPAPMLEGYGLEPQASFARTDMDAGPARQRRRFTSAPTHVSASVTVTRSQLDIFEGWYRHRIDDGAAWFDGPLYNGRGKTTVEFRFLEPWTSTPLGGGVWRIACKWETRNRPVMSESELAALGIV